MRFVQECQAWALRLIGMWILLKIDFISFWEMDESLGMRDWHLWVSEHGWTWTNEKNVIEGREEWWKQVGLGGRGLGGRWCQIYGTIYLFNKWDIRQGRKLWFHPSNTWDDHVMATMENRGFVYALDHHWSLGISGLKWFLMLVGWMVDDEVVGEFNGIVESNLIQIKQILNVNLWFSVLQSWTFQFTYKFNCFDWCQVLIKYQIKLP